MESIRYPEYLGNVDYSDLCLNMALSKGLWAGKVYTKNDIVSMHNFIKECAEKSVGDTNQYFYKWWKGEMREALLLARAKSQTTQFFEMNSVKGSSDGKVWFVTIGINPLVKSIPLVVSVIDDLMSNDWIVEADWVYENHTEFGEHLHVMCKIVLKDKITKSVLIQKICKYKGLSKIVVMNHGRTSSFVSALPYVTSRHDNYLDLLKTSKKELLLDKDIEFRKTHNLQTKYTKRV